MGLDVHLYDPNFPPPQPVREILDPLANTVQGHLCANRDWILGAAGLGSMGSGPMGLYSGLYGATIGSMNCSTPGPPPGGPGIPYLPGQGGQCVATYQISGFVYWYDRFIPNGRRLEFGPQSVYGPLTPFQFCRPFGPNATLCDAGLRDRNGDAPITVQYYSNVSEGEGPNKVNYPGSGFVSVTSMTRADGQPDNCGNAKPIGGGGNGRVTPPQTPPIIHYAPVTINNIVVNIPITVGPIVVNPKFGPFNLSIGINGAQIPLDISLTGNINFNSSSSYYITDYNTDPPTSEDQKDEDKKTSDNINGDVTYRLQAFNCAEEIVDDVMVTGSPLEMILAAIQDVDLFAQERFYLQCDTSIKPVPPIALGTFTAQETEQILELTGINKRAIGLQIVCTNESENVRPYAYSVSKGLAMARWGVAAAGTTIGGKTTYLPGEPLYYPDDFLTLPDLEVTSYAIRLTGVPGCTYTVYDCGLRR